MSVKFRIEIEIFTKIWEATHTQKYEKTPWPWPWPWFSNGFEWLKLCDSRKIQCLTSALHVKLHRKTDIALIAKKYHEKTLTIALEIGDSPISSAIANLEGSCYENLGTVFKSLGDYVSAKSILRKRLRSQLQLVTETEKNHEGTVFLYLGDYVKANVYYQKAIVIALKLKNN